jgi:hypothetical protein
MDPDDVEAVEQILAERAALHPSCSRFWWVAAMIRTSTFTGTWPPTR